MRLWQKKWFLGVLLVSLSLPGCALSPKVITPESQFFKAQDDFMQRLRWRDFQGAARHFTAPRRDEFLQRFRRADDLNLTDVRLQFVDYDAAAEQMATEVEVEYFLLPSATVRTFRFTQQWSYFREPEQLTGEWRITSHFPEFPGLESP